MEAGLLLVTVFCMTILAFIQTNQSFIVVYAGAAFLYLGLFLNAIH